MIGCMLLDPRDRIPEAVAALRDVDAFYDVRHRLLWEELCSMQDRGEPIDPVTLPQRLRQRGLLEQAGGIAYISQAIEEVHSVANLPHWLGVVRDRHMLRRMQAACREAASRIDAHAGEDAEELLAGCEQEVLAVRSWFDGSGGTLSIREYIQQAVADMERDFAAGEGPTGISTGLADLDRATRGLHAGELTVVAALPGTGKTALALDIVRHAAVECGVPCAVFSMEMAGRLLVKRMMCSSARVNPRRLTEQDFRSLTAAQASLVKAGIHIDQSSDLTIQELRSRARRLKQKHGVRLVAVDYIQIMSSTGLGRNDSPVDELKRVSSGLKRMAVELDCAVLAMSQVNDDGKLKGCRGIGEDGDNVWDLQRGDEDGLVWLTIKKQRNGEQPVSVPLTFIPQFTRFENAARIEPSPALPRPANSRPRARARGERE